MIKKLLTALIIFVLIFGISLNCFADFDSRHDYAIGWQVSGPASGFCLKIPYKSEIYLEPVFSITMSHQDTTATGHYVLGVRGIHNLPPHQDFLPYAGLELGYNQSFQRMSDSRSSNSNFGYQAFFGVEYQKYLLRPALEVGIGGTNKSDGSFHAGVIFNLSVRYYFWA